MLILSFLNGTSDTITAYSSSSVLLTVLSAGLSVAIGQSIILFINRVKPGRFILSLMIQALIFTFGYFFLSFSTWFVGQTFFGTTLTFSAVAAIIGLCYAPLIWSFLAALPYLGEPIFLVLSLWSLFLIVNNFSIESGLSVWQSFWCAILGWAMLRVLQQTIGHPLVALGQRLIDKAAGVKIVRDDSELTKIVRAGNSGNSTTTSKVGSSQQMNDGGVISQGQQSVPTNVKYSNYSTTATETQQNLTPPTHISAKKKSPSWFSRGINSLLGLLGLAIASCLAIILLANFSKLISIALIVVIFVALVSPLETLGWWAGWYGDKVDTTSNPGKLLEDVTPPSNVTRYVVYLDGIGQSGYDYDPFVDKFLKDLAATLSNDIVLVGGFTPYSILNIPLTRRSILGPFWRWLDRFKEKNPGNIIGFLTNIRNLFTVAVSADRRYGPLYNQGMAQLVYNSLVQNGYPVDSRTPVTLIGYSGGGQISMGALTYLKQALKTSIEVISLGGVISGSAKATSSEHIYHFISQKDNVEHLGAIIFPKRWSIFFLSYWNRAKRQGQISFIPLGPVTHNGKGGMLDANYYLPDGRSALQETLGLVAGIITGDSRIDREVITIKSNNYYRFLQAEFNQYQSYPINQSVSPELYRPVASWMGRLILPEPEQRKNVEGALFEVHHADPSHQHLVGQVVRLNWQDDPELSSRVKAVTRDVSFSDGAEYSSRKKGLIHPTRLNYWRQVKPLESLAGARPYDDMLVMLHEPVAVSQGQNNDVVVQISREPTQISGRYYGLVKIVEPLSTKSDKSNAVFFRSDKFKVVHFNRQSQQFDGPEEIVLLPEVVPDGDNILPATNKDIEKSPVNSIGWYIYGEKDTSGTFVVKALAPRELFRLQPESVICGSKKALKYIKKESWNNIVAHKGKIQSVLLAPKHQNEHDAVGQWKEGDRALLLHVYGGIGGIKKEAAAKAPVYFGHFSYGNARVIREPLSGELRFEIEYHQVYTHNVRGLIAGNMHWSAYMGDRQWGFLGTRPICDLLVKLDDFTADFDFDGKKRSALSGTISQLEAMNARYRIGDGTGGTYVGPANNCAQDSNQALYASLRNMEKIFQNNSDYLKQWGKQNPEQGKRFKELLELKKDLKSKLMPFGTARADWEEGSYDLGSCLEDRPVQNLFMGLASWRTLLPRLASDTIVKIFLEQGASVWVLRTNQVGGHDSDIEPLAPTTIG